MNQNFVRNEIGSEFWSIPTTASETKLFPAQVQWFISGTAALQYILRDIQKTTLLRRVGVPSWCCSCMIQPFLDHHLEVVFYPVYPASSGGLTCDYRPTAHCDATLVLSYFGYEAMETIGSPGGLLIRDLTHSLFCPHPDDADYYFGSLRKWAGFWTGGYGWKRAAWTDPDLIPDPDPAFLQLRRVAMEQKTQYLTGLSENKDYLSLFEEAEDHLDHCGIAGSCQRDIRCALSLDHSFIKQQRRSNAATLLAQLRDLVLFPKITATDCPMFVPILLPDRETRDALRRELIAMQIYCPVHWPVSELHVLGERERILYDRSLSLVCDQRYTEADMQRIAQAVRCFMK